MNELREVGRPWCLLSLICAIVRRRGESLLFLGNCDLCFSSILLLLTGKTAESGT